MPLDPVIANPATLKIADPLEQYTNYLRAGYLQDQIAEAKAARDEKNALRSAWSDPSLVGKSGDEYYEGVEKSLLTNKRGDLIPGVRKTRAEIDKIKAEGAEKFANADKSKLETYAKRFGISRDQLANISIDPSIGQQQRFAQIKAESKDPIIAEFNASMGISPDDYINREVGKMMGAQTPETWKQYLAMSMAGAENGLGLLNNKIVTLDNGGTNEVISVNELNPSNPTTLLTRRKTIDPNRPQHTINLTNEAAKVTSAYESKRAELQAMRDDAKQEVAETVNQRLDDIQRARQLLGDDKAFTGAGAPFFEKAASVSKTLGFPVTSDDKIAATQELRIFLSTNMLENIANLRNSGVKLGSVTEKEFDQLMASAPKITDQPEVIDAWLGRAERNLRRIANDFNYRNEQLRNNESTRPFENALPRNDVQLSNPSTANVQLLKSGKITPAVFDKVYGPGAAARVTSGGNPNGNTPFPR